MEHFRDVSRIHWVFEDSVCYSYWFADIHRDGEPGIIHYIKHPNTAPIRLSAMISRDISNRMMAGRCVSSDRETNSALRVKANCMAMGEAAGTSAAIAVQENYDLSDIPLNVLKEKLEKNGAIIPGGDRSFEELFSKN